VFSLCSLAALLWAIGSASTGSADAVPFKTVDRGLQSHIEKAREVVVRTPAEWIALWKEHAPDRPQPKVDFARSIIVGVFLGSRPTGGHGVEITAITREGTTLTVTYREQQPRPDAMVTQVITMPYHLVSIGRFEGPVRFTRAH
jgi:hypothetical protein